MNKFKSMIDNINYVDNFLNQKKYLVRCLKDCTDCCYDYFYVSLPEFYLTLYGILQLPSNLDFYYQKALVTFNYFKQNMPLEVDRLLPLTSGALLANLVEDFNEGEYTKYNCLPSCIFLNNGRCSIYKYRPNTCRKYGTTVTCEYLDNKDYQDDNYTSYHLYPLIQNTMMISDEHNLEMKRYPLWFYYSYYFRKELRPYLFENLNKLSTMSEAEFVNSLIQIH